MTTMNFSISGPAPAEDDPDFLTTLLLGVVENTEPGQTSGELQAMDLDGKIETHRWKLTTEIPDDLALLREARDFSQFIELPKTVKEALFRVLDENDGLWPCEPPTAPAAEPAVSVFDLTGETGPEFRITIAGRHGSGKSTLAQLIAHSLLGAGVKSVKVLNEDSHPDHLESTRYQRLAALIDKNPQITLDMVQLRREGNPA